MELLAAGLAVAFANYLILYASILDYPRKALTSIPVVKWAILEQCAMCVGVWVVLAYELTGPDNGLSHVDKAAAVTIGAVALQVYMTLLHAAAAAESVYMPDDTAQSEN